MQASQPTSSEGEKCQVATPCLSLVKNPLADCLFGIRDNSKRREGPARCPGKEWTTVLAAGRSFVPPICCTQHTVIDKCGQGEYAPWLAVAEGAFRVSVSCRNSPMTIALHSQTFSASL